MRILLLLTFTLFTASLLAQTSSNQSLEKGDFMEFKIVNKSIKPIHAYVKGPKKSGGTFSYGLNLLPYIKRHENWTVGTKLYAVNKLGLRKLIYEFTANDAGTVVDITPRRKSK